MKNEDLKKYLSGLSIPEPDEEARSRTIRSALAEFRRQAGDSREEAKGFSRLGRLMGKLIKGGPIMQRPIAIVSGVAVGFIALAIALSPVFVSQRNRGVTSHGSRVATTERSQIPVGQSSGTDYPEESRHDTLVSKPKVTVNIDTAYNSSSVPAAQKDLASPSGSATRDKFTLEEVPVSAAKRETPSSPVSPSTVRPDDFVPNKMTSDAEMKASGGRLAASASPAAMPLSREAVGGIPVDQVYAGRDKFDTITANPVKLVAEEPVSTFSIDVDTASYAFVRRALNSGYLPPKSAVRIEEMINYFDYDYPLPKDRSVPFRPTVAVFPTPWNPGTKLLHIGVKGYDIIPAEKPKSNLVFLIDVSGSMKSEDKLPLLKNSLRMLVNSLQPDDTVGIVVYAGAAGTVLEPTRVAEKGKILAALDRLHAGGSTAGGEGIKAAYALAEANMTPKRVNRIILATDGDFNVGIQDPEVLKDFVQRKRDTGIYLSILGFGQGNYNDTLMQKLAQNGNGNAAYIDTLSEARKVLVDEASGTLFTIANDVKLQVEFNPATVAEYRLIGYESRLLNREDFNNDAVDAGDIGSGHSVTAIYEITPAAGKTRLIDPLRYQSAADDKHNSSAGTDAEYAFLKIRYKLPGQSASREISKAIGKDDEYKTISKAPQDSRFAAAVAAFGQLLRGDSHVHGFSYKDVIALARDARGKDPYGYRAEFLNLVRLAETAGAMGER